MSVCNLLLGVMADWAVTESRSTHRGGTATLPTPVIGQPLPHRRLNATRHEKSTPRTRSKIFLSSISVTRKPSTSMPRHITTANAWKSSEPGLYRLVSVVIRSVLMEYKFVLYFHQGSHRSVKSFEFSIEK